MNNFDIQAYLDKKGKLIDSLISSFMPSRNTHPKIIHEAMHYSLFSKSKKIRPLLAVATGDALGCNPEIIIPYACALEMIHTHSLIHDDLPSMDNDDFRRGKPSSHKIYGEGLAILAGNGLLVQAFEILSRKNGDSTRQMATLNCLCKAIGTEHGLLGGQVMDLSLQGKNFTEKDLDYIHSSKTGALIEASVAGAAILAGAGKIELDHLKQYGKKVGLAFQIADDLLDETGSPEKMGKKTGKDKESKKATYPALFGIEASRKMAKDLVEAAVSELEWLGDKGEILIELARFISVRRF